MLKSPKQSQQAMMQFADITPRFIGLSTISKDGTDLDQVFRLTWRDLMNEKAVSYDHQLAPVTAAMKPSAVVLDVTQSKHDLRE